MARVKLGADADSSHGLRVDRPADGPTVVPLDQLQPNPENARPSTPEVDEMATDLGENGQLQNLNVMSRVAFLREKPHTQLTSARYVVINGNRRLAGARQAGLAALRVEVNDEWTRTKIDLAMVRENVHRLDLSPLALGRQLVRMLPDHGDSHRKLAAALSKTQAWVSQRVGLTTLHPALQEAVDDGRVLFRTARECTRLHPDLQPLLATGELPEELAHRWLVKERIKPEAQLERWQAGPPYLAPSERVPAEEDHHERPLAGEEKAPATGSDSNRSGEYGVFTGAGDLSAGHDLANDAAGVAAGESPPRARTKASDSSPGLTPPIRLAVPDRSIEKLAQTLRQQLSDDERHKLVVLLGESAAVRARSNAAARFEP